MWLIALLACSTAQTPPDSADSAVETDTDTDTDADTDADTDTDTDTDADTDTDTDTDTDAAPDLVVRGGRLPDGTVTDVAVRNGAIVGIGAGLTGTSELDAGGKWLVPAFIDSHVHVVYRPVPDALAAGGIASAVDLAAPTSIFTTDWGPLRVVAAGPMVTAINGYPTQSWGAGGYGYECNNASAAEAAVVDLHAQGAGVIKLPVTGGNQLAPPALARATDQAHALGLKVASHATSDSHALTAAEAGIDVLAHTPTSALSEDAFSAWESRAVITTLVAFGNSGTTRANLAELHSRGATVLYGTDQGNTNPQGIMGSELAAMESAGMSRAEILAAGTTAPADYWGLDDLGRIEVGKRASFLVLDTDPMTDLSALTDPTDVYIDGVRLGP